MFAIILPQWKTSCNHHTSVRIKEVFEVMTSQDQVAERLSYAPLQEVFQDDSFKVHW